MRPKVEHNGRMATMPTMKGDSEMSTTMDRATYAAYVSARAEHRATRDAAYAVADATYRAYSAHAYDAAYAAWISASDAETG